MFTPQSGASNSNGPSALIPHGTLAFAVVKPTGIKSSKNTGGTYANLELTISEGPYAKRKVWTIVMNPQDANNSEAGKKMGLAGMCRMFEAAGVFNPLDASSYARFEGVPFADVIAALDGLTVAIKIKVSKSSQGYDDKNEVADFLSPAPTSNTSKLWTELAGDGAAARKNAFGQAPLGAPAQPPIQPQVRPAIPSQPPINNKPKWITKLGNGELGVDNGNNNPY